jgi:hypothetical protein
MKQEARQAIHSLYRLFGRASIKLTWKGKDAEPLMPVLPPAWVGGELSVVLQELAAVASSRADELKQAGAACRDAWLHVAALAKLLDAASSIAAEGEEVAR